MAMKYFRQSIRMDFCLNDTNIIKQNAEFIVHKDEFNACIGAYAQHRYMDSYIWKDTDVWIKKKLNWHFLECGEGDYELCPGLTILNLGPGHARGVLALKVDLK